MGSCEQDLRKTNCLSATNPLTDMNDQISPGSKTETSIDWAAELARHRRWLRTVVAARCGESQAVDEIMQEVSMAVIKQSAPLRDSAKVAAWLYQIAVRQSLMYRRKHGRRRKLEQRFAERLESQPRPNTAPNPLDWVISEERRELVRIGLSRLNPKDAEILLLKYTENWSYRQIADHLDTTESAIESRLHRARKKLREIMANLEPVGTNV